MRCARRAGWRGSSRRVALVVALCEAIALIFLAPLKTVVPYTLLVDKQTGFVQELKPLDAQKIAPDTALTQSFLVQYVIARESYDRAQLQAELRQGAGLVGRYARKSDYVSGMQSPTRRARSTAIRASTVDRNAGEERVVAGRQQRAGAVRDDPPRCRRRGAARRFLGRGDPLSLHDRADACRGPLHQSARLPGARAIAAIRKR